MTPSLALCVFGLFLLWLFAKERKLRKNVSFALWIPLSWAFIVGSKPVSLWLGINPNLGSTEYVEDSILDKVIFAVLIASGLVVLMKDAQIGAPFFCTTNGYSRIFSILESALCGPTIRSSPSRDGPKTSGMSSWYWSS